MSQIQQYPQVALIAHGDDVRVSTLEIARHILAGSKQKTAAGVNRDLVRTIKKYLDGFQQLGLVGFETQARLEDQHGGGDTEYAELNEPQTNLLFMSMRNSNPLVWRFKVTLAKRFDEMKRLLADRKNAEWVQYRQSGKIVTKSMNELLTKALDYRGKDHKDYRYINLQQAIYKAALDKTAQQLRKERNIPKHKTIRDYLGNAELQRVMMIQSLAEISLANIADPTDQVIMAAVTNAGNVLRVAANSFTPVLAA